MLKTVQTIASDEMGYWPWHQRLSQWRPVQLDALGLVTLLGHEEVNESLGRLVPSRWMEYFPMLGAFVIAGDRFKEKKPSFNLYNLDQGIHTPELSYWLSRWLLAQDFEKTCSIVKFTTSHTPRSFWRWRIVAFLLSFVFTGLLLAITILADDKYGKVNAIAMIISVMVRTYVLEANRAAIDREVEKAERKLDDSGSPEKHVKVMALLSDSKLVTLFLPSHLIISVFTANPEPGDQILYHGVRWIGWAAFAVHVLTIGNAFLTVQIYCVSLIVIPTVLVHWKFGCDDSKWMSKWNTFFLKTHVAEPYDCWIGSRLKATCFEWPLNVEFMRQDDAMKHGLLPVDEKGEPVISKGKKWIRYPKSTALLKAERSIKRMDLYAWLNLTVDQEKSMGKWDLFPHQREGSTAAWWEEFNEKKALIAADPPSLNDMMKCKHIRHLKRETTEEERLPEYARDIDEKDAGVDGERPVLGEPHIAMKTIAGPDGMVRAQSAQSRWTVEG